MGPRFLSFASTVDAFATVVGILTAIISAEVNAPAPDSSSQTSETQEQVPLRSDHVGGSENANEIDVANDVKLHVDSR